MSQMNRTEEQRNEELAVIERERAAFQRRQVALFAVRKQFLPIGNGQPTIDSMLEFDEAEKEWKEARAEMDRIVDEIRSGKRR